MLMLSLVNIDMKSPTSIPQPQELKDRHTVQQQQYELHVLYKRRGYPGSCNTTYTYSLTGISSLALGLANAIS
jgi:hypothetical protein